MKKFVVLALLTVLLQTLQTGVGLADGPWWVTSGAGSVGGSAVVTNNQPRVGGGGNYVTNEYGDQTWAQNTIIYRSDYQAPRNPSVRATVQRRCGTWTFYGNAVQHQGAYYVLDGSTYLPTRYTTVTNGRW